VAVAAGVASPAFADSTIQGHVLSVFHGLGTGDRGGYGHQFWGGTGEAARFNTGTTAQNASYVYGFCTDANYLNSAPASTYHLIRVTEAPYHTTGNASGPLYTAAQERTLNAIALAARSIGILDDRGFLAAGMIGNGDVVLAIHPSANVTLDINGINQTLTQARWIEGLQNAIWRTLGGALAGDVTPGGPTAAEGYINAVAALSAFQNAPIRVRILGVDSPTFNTNQGQDIMVLIPLPPAAFAGLGTLGMVLVLGHVRRRRNQSM
jgi:hypothetical protein